MQALIVPAANQLEIAEVPPPQAGPYDALVHIEVCGICNSTDHKLVEGTMYWAPPFPFVLGHESVGRVVEVGERVRHFKIGDRVTRPRYFAPENSGLGSANGGFAEFGVVTDARALADDGDLSLLNDYHGPRQIVVPATLSARDAALAISLSETASVLRHLPNPRGLKVVVAGTGVAGLAFTLWFRWAGADVMVLGRREERLAKARELGANATLNTREPDYLVTLRDWAGGQIDGLLEASGDASLALELLTVLKPDGFATAYGVPPTGVQYETRWKNAAVEEHLAFPWVADLLLRGWIKPEWFVSHQWDFPQVKDAFAQVDKGEVLKGFVQIQPV